MSRVFNDERYVSDEVRRRVLEAAEELGYRMNNAARALASGRTRSIGVVTLGTALYGPASLLIGVERAARDTGYALRVVNTLEGEPGGRRRGRGAHCSTRAWTASSSPSRSTRGRDRLLSVDVPVLVLGAPAAFGGFTVVAAGVGADRWRGRPPNICWTWATRPSITSPVRSGGSPPGTVSRAGGRRWRRAAGTSRP